VIDIDLNDPDAVAGELASMMAATLDDQMPRVLISVKVEDVLVMVVEPCMTGLDGTRRGYLWQAYAGDFDLAPSRYEDGRSIPGGARGGELLATSTVSAAAALSNARRVLRGRAA
jgi:hypothetical protein